MVAEFFETPVVVVDGEEGGDGGAEFGQILVSAAMADLFLEGAVEAFDDAVGFRFTEAGEAGDQAVAAAGGWEVVGEVLGAVVVAQLDAAGGAGHAAAGAGEGLGQGFPGGEAVADFADGPAETFAVPVLDEVAEPDPAVVAGPDFGPVGGPAQIGGGGGAAAVVGLGRGGGGAVRGEQAVCAPEAQNAVAADLVAGDEMKAGADLAMAFTGEGRGGEIGADAGQQGGVGERGLGAALGGGWRGRRQRSPLRPEHSDSPTP